MTPVKAIRVRGFFLQKTLELPPRATIQKRFKLQTIYQEMLVLNITLKLFFPT